LCYVPYCSAQTNSTAQSSTLNAGGDINITASGAGQNSDINVIGSTIKAANDDTLKADNQITETIGDVTQLR